MFGPIVRPTPGGGGGQGGHHISKSNVWLICFDQTGCSWRGVKGKDL